MFLTPDALYAISFYDRSEWYRTMRSTERGMAGPGEVGGYFDMAYQETEDAVVVASSGWSMAGWTPLPSAHVLVTDRRTLATSVLPIG